MLHRGFAILSLFNHLYFQELKNLDGNATTVELFRNATSRLRHIEPVQSFIFYLAELILTARQSVYIAGR